MFTSLLCLTLLAIGQAADPDDAGPSNEASLQRILADLAEFEFSSGDEPKPLKVSPKPVLRWSNPVRNVDDAAVFVLLGKARPELIATVMSYRDARKNLRRAYEFLSISEGRLSAIHNGAQVWRPEKPGFIWRTVPDAPAPARDSVKRRRQMHELAAKFQVAVQSDKNRYELRLLTQPLYRYQNAKADILDGALFAFVEGTDPELILALESTVDEPVWQFASGRLTRWEIEVKHGDKVVATFPHMTGRGDPSDVYLIPDAGPLDVTSKPERSDKKP